ncbi:hypothetical protein NDS46_25015 [Paenibacillus thiaminolyticus]|uniref:hypothetical protein n=1 Tax=Paenibacillus thiaminolyticus TaxID=49283 RepID=UPI00232E2972|nr:hypothetical protein [Paenibacillus thiaminolyticus]WCF07533.1 hypothetical protein NDS46_25015 [Paenibacillus thiaminolyticus]
MHRAQHAVRADAAPALGLFGFREDKPDVMAELPQPPGQVQPPLARSKYGTSHDFSSFAV